MLKKIIHQYEMLKAENPKAAKKHGENWLMSTDKLLIFQETKSSSAYVLKIITSFRIKKEAVKLHLV